MNVYGARFRVLIDKTNNGFLTPLDQKRRAWRHAIVSHEIGCILVRINLL